MKNQTNRKIIFALIGALVVTFFCGRGYLRSTDQWMQDKFFQIPEAVSGDILLIGITKEDIDRFGPYSTWDRSIMASALEALASDPQNKPAVVAIDVQYLGTTNEESDKRLADAAANLGNVVTATTANLGAKYSFGSNAVTIDSYAILGYEEPYDELKNVTTQGHINAMPDKDGVLRHAVLYVEPDGQKVYSMAYQAASIYAAQNGMTIEDPPVDSRGHFYVPFSAKPDGYYDGISLSQVIDGEVPPSFFAGKIVFIGLFTTGIQDAYITAIDRSTPMYGVEYQANVTQCYLNGNYKTEVSDMVQLLVLGLVCFAFFYFCYNRRLLFTVPLLIIFLVLGIGSSMLLYSAGYITHVLWFPMGIIVLFIITVAGNYIRAAIARQNVTRTFERYVAPSIVGEILKEGTENLKLGGKLCDIAVLFVDIRGFTTMSERLSPEEVVNILNQYLTMTASCIEKNNGTLDKFVGDATMAFWGAPLPQEDPVMAAAKTALDIIDGAKELSKKLKEEINEELNVGVGVHFGPAVVGNMGSEKRMDYTAIGDTVNTAARLEANAPGGTVYISRSVAEKLGDRMKYESLGDTIRLKGKAEGFEVLKLLGPEE
ncbi:MAG: adenylate/guanylate cyclase domain-containing protein [Clostridiales bacterium]|nr:adenylate/guanylate cyclase domain-containing protein [Clostridiales bacterium]